MIDFASVAFGFIGGLIVGGGGVSLVWYTLGLIETTKEIEDNVEERRRAQ